MDVHIQTYMGKCNMCAVPYDFIGMVETREEDMEYVFQRSGLSRILVRPCISDSYIYRP